MRTSFFLLATSILCSPDLAWSASHVHHFLPYVRTTRLPFRRKIKACSPFFLPLVILQGILDKSRQAFENAHAPTAERFASVFSPISDTQCDDQQGIADIV